ncbi:MAG: hypothetical protein NVS3B20_05030 [Polyangiales bacterium]
MGGAVGLTLALSLHLPRAALVAVLGALGGLFIAAVRVRARFRRVRAENARASQVVLTRENLVVSHHGSEVLLLHVDRPFGATLLTSPTCDALVLALTHRDGVEYIGGRSPTGSRNGKILSRAVTTAKTDLPFASQMPVVADGDGLLELVEALELQAKGALDRMILSDAGMADVVLDDKHLRAGQLDFDLRSPLGWRSYTFQEGSSFAAQSYQATHIKQGEREVVLVALSPSDELYTAPIMVKPMGPAAVGPLSVDAQQRSLALDHRPSQVLSQALSQGLSQALLELPPPRALRIAIDRIFMPRIRLALEGAPGELVVAPSLSQRLATPTTVTVPETADRLRQSRP